MRRSEQQALVRERFAAYMRINPQATPPEAARGTGMPLATIRRLSKEQGYAAGGGGKPEVCQRGHSDYEPTQWTNVRCWRRCKECGSVWQTTKPSAIREAKAAGCPKFVPENQLKPRIDREIQTDALRRQAMSDPSLLSPSADRIQDPATQPEQGLRTDQA